MFTTPPCEIMGEPEKCRGRRGEAPRARIQYNSVNRSGEASRALLQESRVNRRGEASRARSKTVAIIVGAKHREPEARQ